MLNKELIAQLSHEIQERTTVQMETGKKERMQKYAVDGKIDSTGLMAFVLSEAKLYASMFTTDMLLTLAEYEEMDEKAADGTLEMPPIDKSDYVPLQMDANWTMAKVGDKPPENLVIEDVDPFAGRYRKDAENKDPESKDPE